MAYGHMNFFEVNECGLYRWGQPESHGCELAETFDLIREWVGGRTLADTLPWDEDARSGMPKCYCHDIYKDDATGDTLIVLWKSDTDKTGAIWGAQENGTIGTGQVVKYTDNYKGRKVIWGRPCYYWVVPSLNIVASIKFEFSLADSALFQAWVAACINNRVQHENRRKIILESGVVRIGFGKGEGEYKYRYGFDMHLKTLATSSSELGSVAARVTHILKRETVRLGNQKDERAEWVKLFDKVPYLAPRPKTQKRQVEIRAEAKPTVSELRAIIEAFAREDRKRSDWDNLGFETDTGVVWVDRFRLRSGIEMEDDAEGAFTAAAVYSQIAVDRDELLAPLRRKAGRPRARIS